MHWMDIENHDITELGEPELAHDIERRGQRLFDEIATAPPRRATTASSMSCTRA